jgi:hypothetical protein
LTKFDKIVKECTIERLRSGGSDTVDWKAAEALAIGDAREQIKENICRKLEQIIGGGVKSEIITKEGKHDSPFSTYQQLKERTNYGFRSQFD